MEKTKTLVIFAIVIIVLLGIVIYSQWDKITGKDDEETQEKISEGKEDSEEVTE